VGSLAALVVALPFERVVVAIPGVLTITTLEAVALGVAAIGVWQIVERGRRLRVSMPGAAAALLVGVLTVAAILAPAESSNAVRFVARIAMASLIALVVSHVVREMTQVRALVRVLVGIATIVGVIAVLEALQVRAVVNALTFFRPGFHVIGGQLRATSTLMYPTIASMFLEVAFAAGLWVMLQPVPDARRERPFACLALAAIGAGIAATFTRAGLIGIAVALTLVGGVAIVAGVDRRGRVRALGVLAAAVVAAVFLLHSPELLAARMSSESSAAWYGARYQVPPTLRLATGRPSQVPVTLTNTGRFTWDSTREPNFLLSYHWLRGGSEAVIQFDGQRTPFPDPVTPGRRITMNAWVIAPTEPGDYTLVWDVVHESRAWFSTEGVTPALSAVRVEGAPTAPLTTVMPRLPGVTIRPTRLQLWRAAWTMWLAHPWLGVGPDNFRLTYGRYAGIDRPDPRVHANSMYLEALSGAGLFGLAALLVLVASCLGTLVRRTRAADGDSRIAHAAFLSALVVIAGHGLVDSFLSFTTTYLTFAIVCGLAFSEAWSAGTPGHAHRI
jgi:hypothetical protein